MSKYKRNVKRLKTVQIVLVAVCILAFAVYGYFLFRPKITGYTVRDECGPIGGTVSHSIDDVDACTNACNAYCKSLDKEYFDSSFDEAFNECNSCKCQCQE